MRPEVQLISSVGIRLELSVRCGYTCYRVLAWSEVDTFWLGGPSLLLPLISRELIIIASELLVLVLHQMDHLQEEGGLPLDGCVRREELL